MIERCPHCNQKMLPMKPEKFSRICRKCGSPIRQHHKWKIETDGAASWVEHRQCDNPGGYHPKGNKIEVVDG